MSGHTRQLVYEHGAFTSVSPDVAALLDALLAGMRAALCDHLSLDRRIDARRSEIIEQGIRMVCRRTFGETSPAA